MVSFASFTGEWQGSGHVEFLHGNSYDCNKLNLHIEKRKRSFKIKTYRYLCDNTNLWGNNFQFRISRDGILYYKGHPVGVISEEQVNFSLMLLPGTTVMMKINMEEDGSLSVLHIESNGHQRLELRGVLEDHSTNHL